MNHDLKRRACPYAGAPFMRQAEIYGWLTVHWTRSGDY
jgi:hypothetical protein